jgi:D-alanyl-D-alanine carboxypeptidase/D-alanyl-D-alanine-endopeptidase (penicillin-binding protein 4)
MFALHVGPHDGLCCEVRTTPAMPGLKVVNLTQTDPAAAWGDLGIFRPAGSTRLFVYGAMRPHVKTRRFVLASPDPARMAGDLLEEALVRQGIRIDGGVRVLHWPKHDDAIGAPGTVEMASIRSPQVKDIVHHALKHSDNLYAQLLLLDAGSRFARRGKCPDRSSAPRTTAAWGLCAMRAMLTRIGIDRYHARFEEGSGLSRKDLVTPRATTQLLAWAARQSFAKAFRDALPVAGVDGTLKYRMRRSTAADNVHAKTGTLRYSYALSGYVTTKDGRRLAFSLMLDRYARPTTVTGSHTRPSPQHDLDTIATILAGVDQPRIAQTKMPDE